MGLLARDVMVSPIVQVPPSATLADAAKLMVDRQVGAVLVMDAGLLVGIVTESDFVGEPMGLPFTQAPLAHLFGHYVSIDGLQETYRKATTIPVSKVMRRPVITVPPEAPIETVVELMVRHRVKRIPVAQDERPLGIVARHDLLRVFAENAGP